MIGIYKYQNLVNGKVYIGQSKDITRRKKDHASRALNDFSTNSEYNSPLHRAMRKYGIENFSFEVIEECKASELNEREIFWINYYDAQNSGYNLSPGGSEPHFCKHNEQILDGLYNDLLNTKMPYKELCEKYGVSIGFVSEFNNGNTWRKDEFEYPIRKERSNQKQERRCLNCGKIVGRADYCPECAAQRKRLVERPTKEVLKTLIRTKSFVDIGKDYGVSDNAVRKWCDTYGLPRKKTEIKSYSDEEWELI